MKKGLAIATCLFALVFVGAGCGSDDKSSSDKSSDSGGSAQTQTTKSSGGAKVDTNNPQVQQAIKQCQAQVDSNPQLSDRAKSKVREVCKKAASGDADAAVKATKEACKIIVEDTAPAGTARDTALQACDKAGT